ncbi:MAG TPA: replication-relaxation family protein [Intrasporangium sp.]|uniref:replication-relaxation family protein n=1 Tax=Intrasporangium sp. TaxID=1925024 RepID=UPI002B45BD52|nr:replication-relaxation family protein [Intrasporangium sp.]HKX66066.1 replication-relaxation family protein [Intrasporangium sp.]
MTTVARAPLVRAGPGVAAWTALPERDRALLLWLVQGDVVTAELAALLCYGHLRIAQRRLAKLVGYGLLSGFWAANRQRPRGRYAYALTKQTRQQLERLVWPEGKRKLPDGQIETVSPVIHQLATHDVFASFLRAVDHERDVGITSWVPERALIRLNYWASPRPDALAVIGTGDASIVLFIERDLGTERGGTLWSKVKSYRDVYDSRPEAAPVHVGLVVDTPRRAASVRRSLRGDTDGKAVHAWVTIASDLATSPYDAVWLSPSMDVARTVDLAAHWTGDRWDLLAPGCLADPDALEMLDDRVIGFVPLLRAAAR